MFDFPATPILVGRKKGEKLAENPGGDDGLEMKRTTTNREGSKEMKG